MLEKPVKKGDIHNSRLSVAPMMDWTDRHCRYFHRLMSARALLYTEMVTAPALVRGGALHLLQHDPDEHPVALQLGGSDPGRAGAGDTAWMAGGLPGGEPELRLSVRPGAIGQFPVPC